MEVNLVSMSQQFTGLPMDALIGGPLNAAADANAKMALSQTKFILDTCFVKSGTDSSISYQAILVTMKLNRSVRQDEQTTTQVETVFQLPLMTLIPLNALAVDQVDIHFDMEVYSSYVAEETSETKEQKAAEASLEAKIGFGVFSAEVRGKVSYDASQTSSENQQYKKSNAAKYSVSVHAGQLPLSTGVTTLLDLFSKAMDPVNIQQQSSPQTIPQPSPQPNAQNQNQLTE
ncbi:DUF2589 domain-containing protein [Myroides sp. NP-2]|uniref:DUF2589 domain-containing protein n=1 Tax=Myroides sp. NP-2 TaxID=2759945 RepID=UPI0015FC40C3|nr:DUF2589 domain-containing protein [Myroides sp. NP-2]MBB1150449.1 DUF2589 domain-containing protein [Myroides sp. NP-2]